MGWGERAVPRLALDPDAPVPGGPISVERESFGGVNSVGSWRREARHSTTALVRFLAMGGADHVTSCHAGDTSFRDGQVVDPDPAILALQMRVA